MKKRIKKTPLLIAASLATLLTIGALSAYLTDWDVFNHTYTTASSLDISINTDDVGDGVITHGETLDLNPTITNNSEIDAYVFAEIDADGFDIQAADGWEEIEDGVYAYDSEISPGSDVSILSSLTLEAVEDPNVETGEDVPLSITAYGIQAAGYEDKTAAERWVDVQSSVTP